MDSCKMSIKKFNMLKIYLIMKEIFLKLPKYKSKFQQMMKYYHSIEYCTEKYKT